MAHCFHAQDADGLDDVVGLTARGVDLLVRTHHGHEVNTLCVEHPLSHRLARACLTICRLPLWLTHEDSCHALDTAQGQLRKHAGLEPLEEHVVFLVVTPVATSLGAFVHWAIGDEPHAHHELISVVVVADHVENVSAIHLQHLAGDTLHREVLI